MTPTNGASPLQQPCIDTSIPEDCVFHHHHDPSSLPSPYQAIPSSVTSLEACARWQIDQLETASSLVEEVEDALDDGFVLCDLTTVSQKLLAWRHLFPRIKPFFALKCNPDPMVAAVLGRSNEAAGFDCASLSEITLALQSTNNNPSLIVYANPQRAEKDLETSLELGVQAFTVDGEEELYKIHKAHQKIDAKTPQIIIRILVPDEHSTVPLGEKFGAPPTAVQTLVRVAISLHLPVIGVSFHCGSGCHNPQAYATAIRLAHAAIQVIDQTQFASGVGQKCWILDIGGGFPGLDGWKGDRGRFTSSNNNTDAPDTDSSIETAANVANAINPLLDQLFPPTTSPIQIISEPGRYFVEAAFCLCSRIYRVRLIEGKYIYTIAQGVQGVFKDVVLCGETFHPIPLKRMETSDDKTLFPSTVEGPSGDAICQLELPKLQVGDWLLFDRMGAYTLSISARSGRPPIRYVMGGCAD